MTDRIDSERLEQAVGWRVRLAESPELYAEELSSWLAQDPRNREAWRSAQASWASSRAATRRGANSHGPGC